MQSLLDRGVAPDVLQESLGQLVGAKSEARRCAATYTLVVRRRNERSPPPRPT
jgi:hypothetical protein